MSEDILFRKLSRLKALAADIQPAHPGISSQLTRAFELLSDPSTHLDIVPRESLNQELLFLKCRVGTTTGMNRDLVESVIAADIRDDKNLIKQKIANLKSQSLDDLIEVAASIKVIRKVVSALLDRYYDGTKVSLG